MNLAAPTMKAIKIVHFFCMVLSFILVAMVVLAQSEEVLLNVQKVASDHYNQSGWSDNPFENREGFIKIDARSVRIILHQNEKFSEEDSYLKITSAWKPKEEGVVYEHTQLGSVTVSEYQSQVSSPKDGRQGIVNLTFTFKDDVLAEWTLDVFLNSEIFKPQRLCYWGIGMDPMKNGNLFGMTK